MKTISVVAAVIFRTSPSGVSELFATERGYGEWKGWWEFPGGKIEQGESPQSALEREIREELATHVRVKEQIAQVDYDYPDFHLHMRCFECEVVSGDLELLEHESAAWLCAKNIRSVKWLPADELLLPSLEAMLEKKSREALIRHKNMAAIRSTGGSLETSLRSQLFRFGFRFRKNDKRLAGSPDIVFPHYHAVIFVNGCFWHAHGWSPPAARKKSGKGTCALVFSADSYALSPKCSKFRMPKSNEEFWTAKFTRNRERDIRDISELMREGWRVCVVWECSITGKNRRSRVYDAASRISLWLEEGFSEPFMEF